MSVTILNPVDPGPKPSHILPKDWSKLLGSMEDVNNWKLTDFQRVMKFGNALKRNKRIDKWHPVRLVVKPNSLLVYRDDRENKLRHHIFLSESKILPKPGPKEAPECRFSLCTPFGDYHFQAPTETERAAWITFLKAEEALSGDGFGLVFEDAEEAKAHLREKVRRGWIPPRRARRPPSPPPPIPEDEEVYSTEEEDTDGAAMLYPPPRSSSLTSSTRPIARTPGLHDRRTPGSELSSVPEWEQLGGGDLGSLRRDALGRAERANASIPQIAMSRPPDWSAREASEAPRASLQEQRTKAAEDKGKEQIAKQGSPFSQKLVGGARRWKKFWTRN